MSVGEDGVGAVVARCRVECVGRRLGAGERRSPGVEAQVVEEFYRENGIVDYERRAEAPDFKVGIERLLELAGEPQTAILCAEENPDLRTFG